ncbi:MAG: hypothetical protein GF401_09970 [Chitinivibrionales bacterium]|nr:hypothetical protein [Chitinivibrionales bacterium]
MSPRSNKPSVSLYYKKEIVDSFVADPHAPFLVSFPRTGSHWLRMVMELYFERPLLTRIFFFHDKRHFLALHTHDLELDIQRRNVLYLYRNPVDTIFSYLRYYKEDSTDFGVIEERAAFYGRHLNKWLLDEDFTKKKTILCFDRLRKNPETEFPKICDHFDRPFDAIRLERCIAQVSKDHVRTKVPDDPRVIDPARDYDRRREAFRSRYGEYVRSIVFKRPELRASFKHH